MLISYVFVDHFKPSLGTSTILAYHLIYMPPFQNNVIKVFQNLTKTYSYDICSIPDVLGHLCQS
jgi:hypothetical protein